MTNYRVELMFSDRIMNTAIYVEAMNESEAEKEAVRWAIDIMQMEPKGVETLDLDMRARYG